MSSLPGCSSGCRATMSDIAVSKWSCGSFPTARASSSCGRVLEPRSRDSQTSSLLAHPMFLRMLQNMSSKSS